MGGGQAAEIVVDQLQQQLALQVRLHAVRGEQLVDEPQLAAGKEVGGQDAIQLGAQLAQILGQRFKHRRLHKRRKQWLLAALQRNREQGPKVTQQMHRIRLTDNQLGISGPEKRKGMVANFNYAAI